MKKLEKFLVEVMKMGEFKIENIDFYGEIIEANSSFN